MMVLEHDFVGMIAIEASPRPISAPADEDADLRVTLVRLASPPAREAIAAASGWVATELSEEESSITADLTALAGELAFEWRRLVLRTRRGS